MRGMRPAGALLYRLTGERILARCLDPGRIFFFDRFFDRQLNGRIPVPVGICLR